MTILITVFGILDLIGGVFLVREKDYRESGILSILSGIILISIAIWHTFFI